DVPAHFTGRPLHAAEEAAVHEHRPARGAAEDCAQEAGVLSIKSEQSAIARAIKAGDLRPTGARAEIDRVGDISTGNVLRAIVADVCNHMTGIGRRTGLRDFALVR